VNNQTASLTAGQALGHLWYRGAHPGEQVIFIERPLGAVEWDMVRTFVRRTKREDLRLRFGQLLDFADETTLRRFFDVKFGIGEVAWLLDDTGAIAGILHRFLVSPAEAEIGLIVRSDLQRIGIGELLLRAALARAAKQHLQTLSALVLWQNGPMLRLAKKIGFVPRKSSALTVELELDIRRFAA
jgi:acetyltransferase